MKVVSSSDSTVVLEARNGFLLFIALIGGLLAIKSGLSALVADPGAGTGLWFVLLTALSLAVLWGLSERVTLTLNGDRCVLETRRLGKALEQNLALSGITRAETESARFGQQRLVLVLTDAEGTHRRLPVGSGPRHTGAAEAATVINNWLENHR